MFEANLSIYRTLNVHVEAKQSGVVVTVGPTFSKLGAILCAELLYLLCPCDGYSTMNTLTARVLVGRPV